MCSDGWSRGSGIGGVGSVAIVSSIVCLYVLCVVLAWMQRRLSTAAAAGARRVVFVDGVRTPFKLSGTDFKEYVQQRPSPLSPACFLAGARAV